MDEKSIFVLIVLSVIGISLMISTISEKESKTTIVSDLKDLEKINTSVERELKIGRSSIRVPAVDNEGNGVVTTVEVESKIGEGRTLVDINQLLFWTDTQYSIQVAKFVAEWYTGYNLSEVDMFYSIDTNAYVIGGPSAGSSLTIATIGALYNQSIDEDIMITGTVNPDGEIGVVGGVLEKAEAAKEIGAEAFLVPTGQKIQTYNKKIRKCEPIGPIEYCTTEYHPIEMDVEKEVGIDIIEVSSVEEAAKYFFR